MLAKANAPTLDDYLRAAYATGSSLDDLARATGLGRAHLRAAMTAAGITIRPAGTNTGEGKWARTRRADQAAAAKVGTQDLPGWLTERREQGWTLVQLAAAVGHSTHWVRWRLAP